MQKGIRFIIYNNFVEIGIVFQCPGEGIIVIIGIGQMHQRSNLVIVKMLLLLNIFDHIIQDRHICFVVPDRLFPPLVGKTLQNDQYTEKRKNKNGCNGRH